MGISISSCFSVLSPTAGKFYFKKWNADVTVEGLKEGRHVSPLQYHFLNKPNELFISLCLIEQATEFTPASSF